MRRRLAVFAVLAAAALGPGAARADGAPAPKATRPADTPLPSIAVLDLKAGDGVSQALIHFVTGAVARAAQSTEAFRVISADDIRALLSLEATKQACGAGSPSCLAEIGGALGADYMISGSLDQVGDKLNLSLSLLDVKRASNVSRASRAFKAGDQSALFDIVPAATTTLLGKAMKGRQGTLVISVTEAGASVKLDGTLVGVSPLAPRKVPAGAHLVEVEKTGFVTQQAQVRVRAEKTTAQTVAMVPSPDFLQTYETHARRMRLGAWISTGVAAVAMGTALVFNARADGVYGSFRTARDQFQAGGGTDPTAYANLQSLASEGQGDQTASFVGFGVAGAAAVASAYFWIAGDDPGRYASVRLSAAPIPHGGFALASVRF